MELISIVFLSLIIMFGIISNVFAIKALFKRKVKISLRDKICLALCVNNLCQTVGYSMELISAVRGRIVDGVCEAQGFMICFLTYSAIARFTSLIVERYLCVVYPSKVSTWLTGKYITALFLLLPILNGLIFGSAPFFGWGRYGRSHGDSTYCTYNLNGMDYSDKTFFFSVNIFAFGLPVILSVICFRRIFIELRQTVSLEFGNEMNDRELCIKTSQKQYISSILTMLIYVASWIPYGVVCFFFFYEVDVSKSLEYFARYVAKTSIITGPFLFCLLEGRGVSYTHKKGEKEDDNMELIDCPLQASRSPIDNSL